MQTRDADPPQVKPTRTVPFIAMMGLLMPLFLLIAGAALTLWRGQEVQQNELKHMNNRQTEILVEMRAINAAIASKTQIDAQQTADIRDHERRITRLEPRQ